MLSVGEKSIINLLIVNKIDFSLENAKNYRNHEINDRKIILSKMER